MVGVRSTRVAVAALIVGLISAAPAGAVVLVTPEGEKRPDPYQKWADRAMVPAPPGRVIFHLGEPCPGTAAGTCTTADAQIYFMPNHHAPRAVFLHELGHVFDHRVLTGAARRRFGLITRDRRSWRGAGNGDSPAERFGDAYMLCALDPRRPYRQFTGYPYRPNTRTHRRVCSLIRRVAERQRA